MGLHRVARGDMNLLVWFGDFGVDNIVIYPYLPSPGLVGERGWRYGKCLAC